MKIDGKSLINNVISKTFADNGQQMCVHAREMSNSRKKGPTKKKENKKRKSIRKKLKENLFEQTWTLFVTSEIHTILIC